MKGPVSIVRTGTIPDYKNKEVLYEWRSDASYLFIDRVAFRERPGAVLCYYNPPMHQVGSQELVAYLEGLDAVLDQARDLDYLLLYGSCAPFHTGGDLKESLRKLEATLEARREKEAAGAPAEEIDLLYRWAEERLEKGIGLYRRIRQLSEHLRVVGICGGGIRFGGSAEIQLMADYILGDSRSGMCFSEALIGLIPGWGGIARSLVKSGPANAKAMALTAKEVMAQDLKRIGIYNEVVEVPFPFPRPERTGDPAADRANHKAALEAHDDKSGEILLPKGLELAIRPASEIPGPGPDRPPLLVDGDELEQEIKRRSDPSNYKEFIHRPLKEVQEEMAALGRPLAPQSVRAILQLLESYDPGDWDEIRFAEQEMAADAALYRDPRFLEGLRGTLNRQVPDFSPVETANV